MKEMPAPEHAFAIRTQDQRAAFLDQCLHGWVVDYLAEDPRLLKLRDAYRGQYIRKAFGNQELRTKLLLHNELWSGASEDEIKEKVKNALFSVLEERLHSVSEQPQAEAGEVDAAPVAQIDSP